MNDRKQFPDIGQLLINDVDFHQIKAIRDHKIETMKYEIMDMINKAMDVRIEKFQSLVNQLNKNEWQPIESAPKDGTEILIYEKYLDERNSRERVEIYLVSWKNIDSWYSGGKLGWCVKGSESDEFGTYTEIENPVMWMPLPEAPK